MKKPTSKQISLFQAKMFPRNGKTGQIEQSSHGKSLAGKVARRPGTVSYEDRKSTGNFEVQKANRRGSAEEEVRKHWDRVTGAWKQISKQR